MNKESAPSRFSSYLDDLKSIDPNVYTRAAVAIRLQVEKDSRQMLADPRTLFISDLMSFIKNLSTSPDYENRLASIWVMKELIQSRQTISMIPLTYFEDIALELVNDPSEVIILTNCVLIGRLINAEGHGLDFVPKLFVISIDKIKSGDSIKVYTGMLLFNELTEVDTNFSIDVSSAEFLAPIWHVIMDTKNNNVREVGFKAINNFLSLQKKAAKTEVLVRLISMIKTALDGKNTPEQIMALHLLLNILDLSVKDKSIADYFQENYSSFFTFVTNISRAKTQEGRMLVGSIISLFAKLDPEKFCTAERLQIILAFYKKMIPIQQELFVPLGEFVIVIGEKHVKPIFNDLIKLITSSFKTQNSTKTGSILPPEPLKCIQSITKGAPNLIQKHVTSILECIFSVGLCESLTSALQDLSAHLHNRLLDIQGMLLYLIANELGGINLFLSNAYGIIDGSEHYYLVLTENQSQEANDGCNSSVLDSQISMVHGASHSTRASTARAITPLEGTDDNEEVIELAHGVPVAGLKEESEQCDFNNSLSIYQTVTTSAGVTALYKLSDRIATALGTNRLRPRRHSTNEATLLAFQALYDFDFSLFDLTLFAADYLTRYLRNDNSQLRIKAAQTILKLMSEDHFEKIQRGKQSQYKSMTAKANIIHSRAGSNLGEASTPPGGIPVIPHMTVPSQSLVAQTATNTASPKNAHIRGRSSTQFDDLSSTSFCINQECILSHDVIKANDMGADSFFNSGPYRHMLISDTLRQIIIIGTTDVDPEVRISIINALSITNKYDVYLAHESSLRTLFIALYDDNIEIRILAVKLIGRLCALNPALVTPEIRHLILVLLTELRLTTENNKRAISNELIVKIFKFCGSIVLPYVPMVYSAVMGLISKDCDDEYLLITSLTTLAELFTIGSTTMVHCLAEVIPLLITCIKEETSKSLRLTTTRCFVRIIEATSFVVFPWFIYRDFFGIIFYILKNDTSQEIRLEAAKLITTIGAVDPIFYQGGKPDLSVLIPPTNLTCKCQSTDVFSLDYIMDEANIWICHKGEGSAAQEGSIKSHGKASISPTTGHVVENAYIMKLDSGSDTSANASDFELTLGVVMSTLCSILSESTLDMHHYDTVVVFRTIIQTECTAINLPIVPKIISLILENIKNCKVFMQETMLRELILIISSIGHHAHAYVSDIFDIIDVLWANQQLIELILALLEEISIVLDLSLGNYGSKFFLKFVSLFTILKELDEITEPSKRLLIRACRSIVALSSLFSNHIHVVVDLLCCGIRKKNINYELRIALLDTLSRLTICTNLSRFGASIIHPVLEVMMENDPYIPDDIDAKTGQKKNPFVKAVSYKAFEVLHFICAQFGASITLYIPVITECILKVGHTSPILDSIFSLLLRRAEVDPISFYRLICRWRVEEYGKFDVATSVLRLYETPVTQDALLYLESLSNRSSTDDKAIMSPGVKHINFENIGSIINYLHSSVTWFGDDMRPLPAGAIGVHSLSIQENDIPAKSVSMPKQIWRADTCKKNEEWRHWLSNLSLTLLQCSPLKCLRACYKLATSYPRVARDLFNYSFLACLSETYPSNTEYRSYIVECLRFVFRAQNCPLDVLQILLDLAEFWENRSREFSTTFSHNFLGEVAERCHAYTRSLRYKETEYSQHPIEAVGRLIAINYSLGYEETAIGTLRVECKRLNFISTNLIYDILVRCLYVGLDEIFTIMQRDGGLEPGAAVNCSAESTLERIINKVVSKIVTKALIEAKKISNLNQSIPQQLVSYGSIGGIFVEGRPVVPGPECSVLQVDYSEIGMYLNTMVRKMLKNRLTYQYPPFLRYEENILLSVLKTLRYKAQGHMQDLYGPSPKWFENVCLWDKALSGYNRQIDQLKTSLKANVSEAQTLLPMLVNLTKDKIRCLFALADYSAVQEEADQLLNYLLSETKEDASLTTIKQTLVKGFQADIATYTAWSILEQDQDDVEVWLRVIPEDNIDGIIIRATSYIKANKMLEAHKLLCKLRLRIDPDLIGLSAESYTRAYNLCILLQTITELQNIISYKLALNGLKLDAAPTLIKGESGSYENMFEMTLISFNPPPGFADTEKERLRLMWSRKISMIRWDCESWEALLRVRKLIIFPIEDQEVWIRFSVLCLQSGRVQLARKTLETFINSSSVHNIKVSKSRGVYTLLGLSSFSTPRRYIKHESGNTSTGNMTPVGSALGAEMGVVKDLSAVGSSLSKYLLKDGAIKDTFSTQQHITPPAADILSITSHSVTKPTLQMIANSSTNQGQSFEKGGPLMLGGQQCDDTKRSTQRDLFNSLIPPLNHVYPHVLYAYCKHLWVSSNENVLEKLVAFTHLIRLCNDVSIQKSEPKLVCRMLIRLGAWYSDLLTPLDYKSCSMIGTISPSEGYVNTPVQDAVTSCSAIWNSITNSYDSDVSIGSITHETTEHSTERLELSSASTLDKAVAKLVDNVILAYDELSTVSLDEYKQYESIGISRIGLIALEWFQVAADRDETSNHIWKCISHTTYAIVNSFATYLDKLNDPSAADGKLQIATRRGSVDNTNDLIGCASEAPSQSIHDSEKVGIGFDALDSTESKQNLLEKAKLEYLVESIIAHFKCIETGRSIEALPTTLRLMTLWFRYGSYDEVETEIINGLASVPINIWLDVIPQLIARLHSPQHKIRLLVHQLLVLIGTEHPQALIYPLVVASKSTILNRRVESLSIVDQIRRTNEAMILESLNINKELQRVAILWPEIAYDLITQASTAFCEEPRDLVKFFNYACQLQLLASRNPETQSEIVFIQMFSSQLQAAWDSCRQFPVTNDIVCLNIVMKHYKEIYDRIHSELPFLNTIDLLQTSPLLYSISNTNLCVPGSYHPARAITTIVKFYQKIFVIRSKQRPRKIGLVASDGEYYAFLLKGHEDLRQDERVMQLFTLINNLLMNDSYCSRRGLMVMKYPITPLSQNSGLLYWVPGCDTIISLIKEFRQLKRIHLETEMQQIKYRAPSFMTMALNYKVDAFKYMLTTSDAIDLCRSLWNKASSAEDWLLKRMNYTRSIAVSSIVGYLLGLGDRHPANLMIERTTGMVLHIDYGDCFEVAMHREQLPEKVPFRLTSIMMKAFESCGTEGSFRMTGEATMSILRSNKDSLVSVLETFIYDPLMSMKVLSGENTMGGKENIDGNTEFYGAKSSTPETYLEGNERNPKAVKIVQRIYDKLTGYDIKYIERSLSVSEQIQSLIHSATNAENLCQLYIGWCPYW